MAVTFDTNVLVYTLRTPDNPYLAVAADLVDRAAHGKSAVLLLQSLTEFSYVAIRKLRMDIASIQERVAALRDVAPVHAASEDDLPFALNLVRDHRINFWDALMCATASRAGLDYLFSEDLQDGRRFGGLTIVNPFRPENAALIDRVLPPQG
jgi:predicted nucleic acid-binding protein